MKIKETEKNMHIGNELIWNNSLLKIDNKTVYYKNWMEKGIKYIKHIFDYRTKEFYTFTDMKHIYNIPDSDFLKYNSLKLNIPTDWKVKMQQANTNLENPTNMLEKLIKSKQINKLMYISQINNLSTHTIKAEEKWNTIFPNEELQWKTIYTTAMNTSIDIKIKTFQYKFLHRIIPTNKLLMKQNLCSTSLCDFCSMYAESITHLFWECCVVQTFWTNLKNYLNNININISLNLKSVCFGSTERHILLKSNNFVIFCAKYFIFINKCRKTIPILINFKNYLSTRIKIEQQIAFQNDKLEQHNNKWRRYLPLH